MFSQHWWESDGGIAVSKHTPVTEELYQHHAARA